MNHLEIFNSYRDMFYSMAYRMLGSTMDSEDIIQEAFLKWQNVDLSRIKSAKSYLTSIVINLSIDYLRSAKVKRESYFGTWLPEPLLTENNDYYIADDSISMAFMIMLEKLSPVERAVFLLHDIFDFDYSEISLIVDKSEANCRQIVHRASEHLKSDKKRFSISRLHQEELISQFMNACNKGDINSLVSILVNDITVWSDGGGKATAAPKPIYGINNISRFLISIAHKLPENYTPKLSEINGQIAILGYSNNRLHSILIFDISDKIENIYIVINPDKLVDISKKL